MKKYVMIAIGGFLGAILRMLIKNIQISDIIIKFPLQTLFINVIGSFLLAFVFAAALRRKKFDPDIKLGITTGFLGAFTTFSTLCKDTIKLIDGGSYDIAVLYLLLSIILGLTATYLGAVSVWKHCNSNRSRN